MWSKAIALLLILSLNITASASVSLAPTTTVAAQTQHNTSSSVNMVPTDDTRAGIVTKKYIMPAPINVSNEPPTSLPYNGWNGRALVHVMGWFDTSSCVSGNAGVGNWSHVRPARSGHWCIGYNSNSASQIHAMVNDMIRRGFGGITYTWNGRYNPGTVTQKITDQGLNLLRNDLEARCVAGTCPFFMLVMPDTSALTYGKTYSGFDAYSCCNMGSAGDEAAFASRIKDNYCYFNKFFFGSPAYLKINGRPVAPNFMSETGLVTGAAPSWQDLWIGMKPFTDNLAANCTSLFPSFYPAPNPNNGVPWQIFGTGNSAFAHDGLSTGPAGVVQGAYLWENANSGLCGIGVASQDCSTTNSLNSAESFYNTSLSYSPSAAIGAAWPGFDDQNADWSPNAGCAVGSYCTTAGRVFARNCGMTYLNSWATAGGQYSTAKQLPLIHVVTWNDYDEGTVIEPGIDNCYSITSSMNSNGHTINWTLSTADSRANLATISHVVVYGSLDGTNLGVLAARVPVTTLSGSLDLDTTLLSPGDYQIFVQAVGKNSIINHWSKSPTNYVVAPVINPPPPPPPPPPPGCPPNCPPPPPPPPCLTCAPTPRWIPFTPPTYGSGGITLL